MSTAHTSPHRPFPGLNDFVSSDFLALASHMNACERSHGRLFHLHATLETLHALASPRIVTCAAILVTCSLGLLAFA